MPARGRGGSLARCHARRPGRLGGRCIRNRRRCAFDQRPAVNVDHDVFLDQEFVGGPVGFQQMCGQALLDQVLHREPQFARQRRQRPLFDQVLRQDFGPQDIFLGQFGNTFQPLNAQPQIVELPTGAVQKTQGEPGGKDLVLHHLVAHQLEFPAVQRHGGSRRRCMQRFFPGSHRGLNPDGFVFLERHPAVAAVLHFAGVAGCIHRSGQAGLDVCGQRRHHACGEGNKLLTRLASQTKILFVVCSHSRVSCYAG